MFSCVNNNASEELEWTLTEGIYDELPIFLRNPDYENIWEFKELYSRLITITHTFDKVKENGLPQSEYNKTLDPLDEELCVLFRAKDEGIIFLIETFGGERNYYYYISSNLDFQLKFQTIKENHKQHLLTINDRFDSAWTFIEKYPIDLYSK